MKQNPVIVEVKNLHTWYFTREGIIKVVNGVSFAVRRGETTCILGESGCGKTTTALSLMGLIRSPGKIVNGEILFNGVDLLKLDPSEMRKISGKKISMVFQEPMTSLNPVFTVGDQVAEVISSHEKLPKKAVKEKALETIKMVGIPDAERIYKSYPHELSGGMRQRIIIGMALACSPELLLADEPTTALDVTVQAQILDLLKKMKEALSMSILLITHDLGVVAEMADYVVVMHKGEVVEEGPAAEIFKNPEHPYTIGLLKSKSALGVHDVPGVPVDLSSVKGGKTLG